MINPVHIRSSIVFLVAFFAVTGIGVETSLAQLNEKKVLRDASGSYKGTNFDKKGGNIVTTGTAKVKYKKGSTPLRITEDPPSNLIGTGKPKNKTLKVSRNGKKIKNVRKGKMTETAAGTVIDTFTGTGKNTAKKRGKKWKSETSTNAVDSTGNPRTGFFTGKG